MEIDPINDFEGTPITEETFQKQGWEKVEETEDGEPFHYYILPLPKDNPDKNAPCLISSANDDWEYLGLPKGTFRVEIFDLNGLGYCEFEEDIEDLYAILCKEDLMDDKSE